MGFRNAGLRAAFVLGLAMAVALAVAASLTRHPARFGGNQPLPASFLSAPAPPAIGRDADH